MGRTWDDFDRIVAALKDLEADETLVVVSTDLSHYLPYAHARAADAVTVEQILALDASIDHDQACGATPLNCALRVARARGLAPRPLKRKARPPTHRPGPRPRAACGLRCA